MQQAFRIDPEPLEDLPALKTRISQLEQLLSKSKRIEAALRESDATFRFLAENMSDVAFLVDMELRTTYVTPSIEKVLGFTVEERMNQKATEQLTPESLQRVAEALAEQLDQENRADADPGRSHTLTLDYYHRNGSVRSLETNFRGMRDGSGALTGFYGVARDITERLQQQRALLESEQRYRELSIVDDLTQLYNARHFYHQIRLEIDRADRYAQPLTLLLLDLDDFKRFNDAYGHVEGDQVLMRLGQIVKRCLRQTDAAYRYGGEEFTILLPMTTSAEGTITAERIRMEFKREIFSPEPGKEVHLTVSIGLAQHRPQEEMKAFVRRVDQLMYRGKKNGKDRICFESVPLEHLHGQFSIPFDAEPR